MKFITIVWTFVAVAVMAACISRGAWGAAGAWFTGGVACVILHEVARD